MRSELLRLDRISKSYERDQVLKYVDLTIYQGDIHALMGMNGVGKSTLLQIITGHASFDRGQFRFQDIPVRFSGPQDATRLGIYLMETIPMVVPQLDLAENVVPWIYGHRSFLYHSGSTHRYVQELLEDFRLTDRLDAYTPGWQLSAWDRQTVRVLCAAASRAKLLVIDEPFSILDGNGAAAFKKILLHARDCGLTILFTSHSFQNVCDIADRISILRAGHCAATLQNPHDRKALLTAAAPILNVEQVAQPGPPMELPAYGAEVFRAENGCLPDLLTPLDLCVHAGEVVGILNVGPTRRSVCESLFGLHGRCSGGFYLDGAPVVLSSPSAAIKAGIGCASDSASNLVPQLTCAQNITLPHLQRLFPRQFTRSALETYVARQYIDFLALGRGDELSSPSHDLSTGMQKRLALARWLSIPLRLLLLNEPFKNLDVNGRDQLTAILQRKAEEGQALIVEVSNFNDLPANCSHLVMINDHRVIGTLRAPDVTSQNVFSMILSDSRPKEEPFDVSSSDR